MQRIIFGLIFMDEFVNLIIHHGGAWDDPIKMNRYLGGQIDIKNRYDVDKISTFELDGIGKELNYSKGVRMWFRIFGLSGRIRLEEIIDDKNTKNMLEFNKGQDVIHIYFIEKKEKNEVIGMEHFQNDNVGEGESLGGESGNLGDGVTNLGSENVNVGVDISNLGGESGNLSDGHTNLESENANVGVVIPNLGGESGNIGVNVANEAQSKGASEDKDDSDYFIDKDVVDLFDESGSDDDIMNDGTSQNEVREEEQNVGDDGINNLNEEDYEEFCEKRVDSDEMHSMHGSDDEVRYPDYNEKTGSNDPALCIGMKFSSHSVFRKALKEWAIRRQFTYDLINNSRRRITTVCKENCGFRIHASKLRDSATFQIKTFRPIHYCPTDMNNKLVTSRYLAEKYLEFLEKIEYLK